jgi:undecaprenyl-diphosphatase
MLEQLKEYDRMVTLFLNGMHGPFMDHVMFWISFRFTWIPLYAFLIWRFYSIQGRKIWISLFCVILMILFTDQTINIIKSSAMRLRPCHDPTLAGIIHVSGGCGGFYGFVSGHAGNTFALIVFILSALPEKQRKSFAFLILWAMVVAYSRVYNGVHYAGDVLCGAVYGALCGYGMSEIYRRFHSRFDKKV